MRTPFNNNHKSKKQFQYNEDRFLFRGEYTTTKKLSEMEEAEIVYSTIRRNIRELRQRVYNGETEFNDEEILKCIKKSDNKRKAGKNNKKQKARIDEDCFDMFNKLF